MNHINSFRTRRMAVERIEHTPPGGSYLRDIFIAFDKFKTGSTYPIATLTVWGSRVEMVWVHDFYRREGYATELWRAVRRRIRGLHGDAVTEQGEALLRRVTKKRGKAE